MAAFDVKKLQPPWLAVEIRRPTIAPSWDECRLKLNGVVKNLWQPNRKQVEPRIAHAAASVAPAWEATTFPMRKQEFILVPD